MSSLSPGDRVIVRRAEQVFDVLDVASNQILATRSTFDDALTVAGQCRGAVWQQEVDKRGFISEPALVLPRVAS